MRINKLRPVLFSILAVALVFCICLIPSTQLVAKGLEETEYVSEIMLFSASTSGEAKKKAESAGYIASPGNLNEFTGYNAVILGYKTTTDKSLAITDISMAQMKSGYKMVSYGDIVEKQVEKLDGVAKEMMDAVMEFADNYKVGSPAAKEAYRILNYYQTTESGNPLLGDYFLSGKCSTDFILKLLSRANTSVINAVYNALVAGTADYGEENWADRISVCEVRELSDNENCGADEDNAYKELAIKLYPAIQQFSEKYENAAARASVSKNDALVEAEKGDNCEFPDETMKDIDEGNKLNENDGDAFYITAYEILNSYKYNETTLLGDYIVEMGKLTFSTTAELRKIYPLVCTLTNGQVGIMRMTGVAPLVLYLNNTEELLETSEEYFKEIDSKVKECSKATALSIWVGTDQSIYDKKVALTDELEKFSQAGKRYTDLTKEDELDTKLTELLSLINFVSLVVSIAYGITFLSTGVISSLASFAVWAGTATAWTVCVSAIGSGVLCSILGVLGCAIIVASYLVLAAMIIVLVIMFVKWIVDLFDDEDEDYTEIPVTIYDLYGSSPVKYNLIKAYSGIADLNAGNGKRWNALYSTTDPAVGAPISVDELGNAFSIKTGSNQTPVGFTPVCNFGEVVAANMNANVRESDANSIWLYYHKETSDTAINEGEIAEADENGYLLKVTLSTEKTEAAAKASLTKRDFKILDTNLSPVSGWYTYLGYMTTNDPTRALTDIRISPRNTSSPYIFGSASYTSSGQTATGDGLFYTSYPCAGTPILADILAVDSAEKAPEGYEPVNLFCGGNAFNFNNGDNIGGDTGTSYENFNAPKRFLYFHPSVMYTSGEEYISGLVFVAGKKADDNKNVIDNYIKELGLTKLEGNFTKGLEVKWSTSYSNGYQIYPFDSLETYLCYSVTYNPYRAITDVKSYTSSPTNNSVYPNFGSLINGGYAVCDIMYQLPKDAQADRDYDEFFRGIYSNHSYADSRGADAINLYDSGEAAPEDFENVFWDNSNLRAKGLYVSGPTEGKSPLAVGDIFTSTEETSQEGFISVQDARYPNSTESHNLAYSKNGSKNCGNVYLYVKKILAEKMYISSVTVVSYNLKKMMSKEDYKVLEEEQIEEIDKTADDICIKALLSSCSDEIININAATGKGNTFVKDYETVQTNCSYIGITRTNKSSEAISGIIKYKTNGDALPTIDVNGVSYVKCGDKINDKNGAYYLYSAISAGAVPGEPITDIDLSTDPIVAGAATALTAKAVDTKDATASLQGTVGDEYYIHTYFIDEGTYMSSLCLGHGKTKNEALCNLLTQGCCIALDMNLNENAGGEYIYLGYSNYSPKKADKNAKFAIRDIIITSGEVYQESIDINGITYLAASSDKQDGLSLNNGTNGEKMYLYYSTYYISGSKDILKLSPISKLGASVKDRVPDNKDEFNWENVMTDKGERANLNSGVVSTTDDGLKMIDCRVYLFVNRFDNSIVPARKITGGHCLEAVEYGSVGLKI